MYPITPIGRMLSCLCTATVGMLISVLADRYQCVYRRKIFFPQEETSVTDPSENQHYQTQYIF
jgi:hypothetical protein